MSVTDLASYRRVASYRDDRARELALWRAYKETYLAITDDPKGVGKLWKDFARDLPKAIRRRAMLGEW